MLRVSRYEYLPLGDLDLDLKNVSMNSKLKGGRYFGFEEFEV